MAVVVAAHVSTGARVATAHTAAKLLATRAALVSYSRADRWGRTSLRQSLQRLQGVLSQEPNSVHWSLPVAASQVHTLPVARFMLHW
jgi:hypothetical protein